MNGSGNTTRKAPERRPTAVTTKKKGHSPAGIVFGILGRILLIALMILTIGGCVVGGMVGGGIYGIIMTAKPIDPESLVIRNFNSYIYDKDGNTIAELKQEENRVWIDHAQIPKQLIEAYVALEDKRFLEHDGIDYKRIGSAMLSYLKHFVNANVDVQGGSTIDQQLIKNLTGNQETTIKRKLQEQWQAIQLEKGLTKEEIITLYLNTIPMGGNFYGVETAAKGYFGKDVRDLTLAESASLSGITNWPNKYMPINAENIKANEERAHLCLSLMLEQGYIDQSEYDTAMAEKIQFKYNPQAGKVTTTSQQSYFVDEVIRRVKRDLMTEKGYSEQYAITLIYNSGLKIHTTLDPKVQKIMDGVFTDPENFSVKSKFTDEPAQAAMVVMDPLTGEVRGLYGGQGEKKGSVLNRAVQSERSPGSSIKPLLVYGPGIDSKKLTAATVIDDVPQYLNGETKDKPWPKNVENANFGLTPVREGVYHSRNVVATLALIHNTGIQNGLEYLAKMGMDRREDQQNAAIAMGGFSRGMSPLQMTAAYTVFANKGIYSEPMFYTRVLDNKDQPVLEKTPVQKQVFSPETIYIMDDILHDVVTKGTGAPLGIVKYKTTATDKKGKKKEITVTIPSGGKTGTTDENKDKWFCGFTPYYVGATWYGYDTAVKLVGADSSAKQIWNKVMVAIHDQLPAKPFFEEMPANVIKATVCMDSGKRPTDACSKDPRGSRVREELFIKGTEPKEEDVCTVHYVARVDKTQLDAMKRPLLATEYCPPEVVEERVFIRRPVEYKPVFPTDKYPPDTIYEVAEGEYCTVHGPNSNLPATPAPGPDGTLPSDGGNAPLDPAVLPGDTPSTTP